MEDQQKYGYVYLTTCRLNGKKYIGKHTNQWVRTHQEQDPKYKGSGKVLKKVIQKYGEENFDTTVIQWCYSQEELNLCEDYYLKLYNVSGSEDYYNLVNDSTGGCKFNGCEEDYITACKKISDSKNQFYASEEGLIVRQRIADTLWNNLTDEEKEEYRRKSSENSKTGWANISDEKRQSFKQKCRENSSGGGNPAARKVRCIETGDEFDTIKQAKVAGYKGDIGAVCMGKLKSCGGYTWQYIDNKYKETGGNLIVKEKKKYNLVNKHPHLHVLCVETNEIFEDRAEVAKKCNCSESLVSQKCRDGKPINGYHWQYIK